MQVVRPSMEGRTFLLDNFLKDRVETIGSKLTEVVKGFGGVGIALSYKLFLCAKRLPKRVVPKLFLLVLLD